MRSSSLLTRALCGLLVALTLAGAVGAHPSTTPAPADGFVHRLAELINGYRERNGLQPLTFAEELAALAGEHSEAMSAQRQLSHEGFRSRLRQSASRTCVENVAWNFPTPEGLLDGWRNSPGHHRNLLEPDVSRMGLAISTRYVTFFACR